MFGSLMATPSEYFINSQMNVRLVRFNAPETRNAQCQAEAELGAKATRRLRELVREGRLEFTYVRCSCPEGTQGTFACNYGRDCGTLTSNGRDVGSIRGGPSRAIRLRPNALPKNAEAVV